jgi:MFS family permease
VCFSTIAVVHGVMALWQNYITLLIGTIVNGISYGGSFAILPYVMNRYYGSKRYGFHLTIVGIFMQIATFFFSYTSGAIYDHFAQSIENGEAKCYGSWCWSLTLTLTCSSCIIACWISCWIGFRENRFVKRYLEDQKKTTYGYVN